MNYSKKIMFFVSMGLLLSINNAVYSVKTKKTQKEKTSQHSRPILSKRFKDRIRCLYSMAPTEKTMIKYGIASAAVGAMVAGAAVCPPALLPYLMVASMAPQLNQVAKGLCTMGEFTLGEWGLIKSNPKITRTVAAQAALTVGCITVAPSLPMPQPVTEAIGLGLTARNLERSSDTLASAMVEQNVSRGEIASATLGLASSVASGINISAIKEMPSSEKLLSSEQRYEEIKKPANFRRTLRPSPYQKCVGARLRECQFSGNTGIGSKDMNPECAIEASQSCRFKYGIEPLHYCAIPGQSPGMSHPDCKGVRYQQGQPLIVCKSLQSLEGKDFEPDSDYIRGCNGAIRAQENNVYSVVNPGTQDADLMDQMQYNVCHEGSDKITCHRIENNQAVITCEFKADKSAVACRQFTLTGKQAGSYVIKDDDGQVYTKDGAPLTSPTCLPGEDVIAQEYAKLLTKPWISYHLSNDVVEITQAESPTLYNLIKNQCDMIPLLRNKPMKFWIENDADDNAMASYNNLWITKGKMDAIVANQGKLQDFKETVGHEVGHSRQHYSGDSGYLRGINLQGDAQKIGYMRLVGCEANADLHGALASTNTPNSIRRFYQYDEYRTCGKDTHYVGHEFTICGKNQQLPDFGITFQEAKAEHPSRSEVGQAYGVHPDSMEDRIPAMLEVSEKLKSPLMATE